MINRWCLLEAIYSVQVFLSFEHHEYQLFSSFIFLKDSGEDFGVPKQ